MSALYADNLLDVTVLIVARASAGDIAGALNMAWSQDLEPRRFEVLVVLDPLDRSGAAERVASQVRGRGQPTTRMIWARHDSLAEGLNIGIARARAPRVMCWQADAIYPRDYLASCLAIMNAGDHDVVIGAALPRLPPSCTRFWSRCILAVESAMVPNRWRVFRACKIACMQGMTRAMYHRRVFQRCGLFRSLAYASEDAEALLRMRRAGFKVIEDPSLRSWYYVRGQFAALDRQSWRQGAAMGAQLLAFGNVAGARATSFFYTTALALLLGAFAGWQAKAPALGGFLCLAAYVASIVYVARRRAPSAGIKSWFGVAAVLARVHLAYGFGAIWGLLTFWREMGRPIPRLGAP